MLEAMLSSPFFGLGLTCAAWCVGVFLEKKTGFLLCNPMLIATIVVVAVLAVFQIPYADYLQGSSMLTLMLSPVTAVLAQGHVGGLGHDLRPAAQKRDHRHCHRHL